MRKYLFLSVTAFIFTVSSMAMAQDPPAKPDETVKPAPPAEKADGVKPEEKKADVPVTATTDKKVEADKADSKDAAKATGVVKDEKKDDRTIDDEYRDAARTRRHMRRDRRRRFMESSMWSSPETNFVDTRIAFIFGDDDFLHKAGQTIVDSPLPGFGNRDGYELFFDNLNSARTGRENQLHLVLYKKLAGYIPGLVTEGAIVTLYDFSTKRDGQLKDDGTYLLIRYAVNQEFEASATMFPVSTDRFRLGFLYDLTWGGAASFPDAYRSLTPGVKFALNHKMGYAFLGFKTARMLTNPAPGTNEGREMENNYGILAGAGIQPNENLKIEANGGYIQMGQNPNTGVEGENVQLFGGSARIAYMQGMKQGVSADLRLFRNDPEFIASLNKKPSYKPGTYWMASLEGNYIMQTLQDPDKYGTTMMQPAYAGAASFQLRHNFLRTFITGFSRSTSFILLNVPSFVPYQALSSDLKTSPELFFAAGFDYHFPELHLTIGLTAGLQFAATAQVDLSATTGSSSVDLGRRTIVIRDQGSLSVLPEGEDALPIFGTKLTATIALSDMMNISLMVLYQNDPNYTTLKTLPNGTSSREFESAHKFGAAIITSAKF